MCCPTDLPFLAYSTNVYLGPLNTFPCSRVWVHLVGRGFGETLERKKFFPPASPVLFCQAPAVCKISPGSGACQHTQLPWCQAVEAQVVSPVPGGQQLHQHPPHNSSQPFLCLSFIQWLGLVQPGLYPSPGVQRTLPWTLYLSPTNSYALYICLFLYNFEFSPLLTSYSLIIPIIYYS